MLYTEKEKHEIERVNRCTDFMLIIRIEVAIIIAANRFTFASQGIDDSSDF